MDIQLKPCLFCGGKAVFGQWLDTLNPNATWIECTGCPILTDAFYHEDPIKAKEEAAAIWNRRQLESEIGNGH